MRITMSERALTDQIRSLENIGPEVTTEEIQHRIDKYARRLFDHIRGYGIQMLQAGFQVSGSLCTMSAQLKPSWDEESVQLRVQGLALLAPVSVSLDQPDLPAFVPNQIMLASMSDNFSAFDHSLQRLTLSELRPAIENAAQQIMSAPVTPPSTEFEAGLQQLEYEAFLAASGKKDPLRKHQEIAEFQQREEAAYTAQQQAAHDAFWEHRED